MGTFLLPVLFFLSAPATLLGAGDDNGKNSVIPVYVDLETTGLSTDTCEILQIAAKAGDKEFEKFILPEKSIPEIVSTITHITKRDGKLYDHGKEVPTTPVKDTLINFIQFLKDAAAPMQRVALVAHNGDRFDIPIILREMRRNELLEPFLEVVESSIDTIKVMKAELPGMRSYKQGVLAQHYGINTDNAHNAMQDVNMLMEVIQKAGIADSKLISYGTEISKMANVNKEIQAKGDALFPQRRHFPDLTLYHPYPTTKFQATSHPEYGRGIRAYIKDQQGNTVYLYLPNRFKKMTDEEIAQLNNDIQAGRPPSIIYKGMNGKAFNVSLVRFTSSQSTGSDGLATSENLGARTTPEHMANVNNEIQAKGDALFPQRRHFPDLTLNHPYPTTKFEATSHPQYGRGILAYIKDQQGNTVYLYLPNRFKKMTDEEIAQLNNDIQAGRPPSIIYKGMNGKAFNVSLVRFTSSQSTGSDGLATSENLGARTTPEHATLLGAGDDNGENSVIPVYVDLKTTELPNNPGEILQIAAKAGDKEFEKFIFPEKSIPRPVSSINRITKRDGKLYDHGKEVPTTPIKDTLISFIQFLKDAAAPMQRVALVAHNGDRFDIPILREMKRNELLESFLEVVESSIDTTKVMKAELPDMKSYELGELAKHYGINTDNAHNAMQDVNMLMEVIQKAGITDSKLISYAKEISKVPFPGGT